MAELAAKEQSFFITDEYEPQRFSMLGKNLYSYILKEEGPSSKNDFRLFNCTRPYIFFTEGRGKLYTGYSRYRDVNFFWSVVW